MPVVGVVSPGAEDDLVSGQLPQWYTPEELLQHSRFKGPLWGDGWTYELLNAAIGEYVEEKPRERVSVTMMLTCPRSAVLERKEDYILYLKDQYRAMLGTAMHSVLEGAARPGAINEGHFLTELGGIQLSCIIDLLDEQGHMYDYKLCKTLPQGFYPYRSQTLQLMYNAFIIRHADRLKYYATGEEFFAPNIKVPPVKSATIVYLGPDFPRKMTIKKKMEWTNPRGKVIEKKMPYVWDDDEVLEDGLMKKGETGLRNRVAAMRLALDSYPNFPPELAKAWGGPEGWACPGKPWCSLPNCLAKRYPNGLVWDKPEEEEE